MMFAIPKCCAPVIGGLILAIGLAAPARAARSISADASTAVVVIYHRFGEDDLRAVNTPMSQLREHIRILKEGGYRVAPLSEAMAAVLARRPLSGTTVVITIDDAFASAAKRGWPALRAAGFPATLFVATGLVGRAGYMSWDQIRLAHAQGLDVQWHSGNHGSFPNMDGEAKRADLRRSYKDFIAEMGYKPAYYAYPYGEADAETIALIRAYGVKAAFGQHSGALTAEDNRWYLPRFALNEHYGAPDRFHMVIDALSIPALDITPDTPTVGGGPPLYGFTVADPDLPLAALACYGPDGNEATVETLGRRVEVRLSAPLAPGRSRINCTLPGPRGENGAMRWRWRGTLFTVPGAPD